MPFKDPARKRAYQRRYQRLWQRRARKRWQRRGLCTTCGQRPVARFRRCFRCRRRTNTNALRYQQRRRAAERCIGCSRPSPDYVRCARCRRRESARRSPFLRTDHYEVIHQEGSDAA